MDVVKAHADTQVAWSNLETSHQLLCATQAALQSTQSRFDHNATDIFEVLNAQGSLANAQQERIRFLAEWRSARLRLLAAVGSLGKI